MDTHIAQATQRKEGILFVVSGPSGVGKGTIVKQLIQQIPDLTVSVSVTTRPPRAGEVEGQDYYFVELAEFQKKIQHNELLEFAQVHHGAYYGTPLAFVVDKLEHLQDVILEIDVQGAQQVKQNWTKRAVYIFIVPPSQAALETRLVQRGTETPEAIQERLAKATEEVAQVFQYHYCVLNDDLSRAVAHTKAIVLAERQRIV